jgi:hypothetical protein
MKESYSASEAERMFLHEVDIDATRAVPVQDGEEVPAMIAATYVDEARRFLAGRELESTERITELLEGLDTAVAINNDPEARALRREFLHRFRPDMVE